MTKETITLYVEDYNTIIDAVDTYELDDEFWHEDIQQCISDGLFGHAGVQLMRMQRKIDAQEVIEKIQLERGKINDNKEKEERKLLDEKKNETSPGLNS